MKTMLRGTILLLSLGLLWPALVLCEETDKTDGLIRDLSSEHFETREKAMRALSELGREALPKLVHAFETSQDQEQKQRLKGLLEPRGLNLKGDPEWIKACKLADKLKDAVEKYLTGKEEVKAKVEEELLGKAPYVALAIRVLIAEEKDAARRERLYELNYVLLSDSPKRAAQIFRYAQELHSVASNCGPLAQTWDKAEQLSDRSKAKFFHACFITPEFYGDLGMKELMEGSHTHSPHRDLPAAADVYMEAKAMYERLAKAEKDPAKAKEYAKGAESAEKGAKDAKEMAEITN